MVDDEGPVTRRSNPGSVRSANKIPVGQAIAGKYRIEELLGSGGMGTVLRAHHLRLDRSVAIKVMHSELLATPDAARRFTVEARATATLKSQHAVRILDIDQLPTGAPFIVMELLEGSDLARVVAERGPLSVDRAIHYLMQATDAISEAHSQGIIHRDLKPQNLFLTNDGLVKVLDFGLAKAIRGSEVVPPSGHTGESVMVGSPHYMAPEQIWSGAVTERTDIWGFGATLYHLLAGTPPFPAPNMAVLSAHIGSHDPPRITDRRDDVSPTVDDVIAKCMRKNPDERYRTVAALQGALLHLRVELQTGKVQRDTAAVASTTPGADNGATLRNTAGAMSAPLASTMPITTRRDGSRAGDALDCAPLAAATEPDLPSADDSSTIVWQGSDEPTQVSVEGTKPEDPSRKDGSG